MRYHELLVESPEMQEGFQFITRLVLDGWARRIAQFIGERDVVLDDFEIFDLAAGSFEEAFKNGKNLKKLPIRLKAFVIRAIKTHLRIAAFPKHGTDLGEYERSQPQKSINLYFEPAKFDEDKEQILKGNLRIIHGFLATRQSTLLHEIVHAFDDFASNGKFTDNKQAGTYARLKRFGQKSPEGNHLVNDLYLRQQHEVNARYAQAIQEVWSYRRLPWADYRERFIGNFVGWHKMTPEIKTRLIKRLAVEWTKDRGREATDIAPYVTKLNNQVRAHFPEVRISRSHGTAIEVEGLNDIPPQAQVAILAQATRLADIFRIQLVTYDNLPALKNFGFVANKGRNIDYRISAPFRRASKRA